MIIRDSIQGITKPALRRILSKSKVKRAANIVYDELRGVLRNYMGRIIRNMIVISQYNRRVTLSVEDLRTALRSMGINLVAFSHQPNSIRRANFNRLVRELIQEHRDDPSETRVSSEMMVLFQYVTEVYIQRLCEKAYMITTSCGRDTLYPQDLTIARECKEN